VVFWSTHTMGVYSFQTPVINFWHFNYTLVTYKNYLTSKHCTHRTYNSLSCCSIKSLDLSKYSFRRVRTLVELSQEWSVNDKINYTYIAMHINIFAFNKSACYEFLWFTYVRQVCPSNIHKNNAHATSTVLFHLGLDVIVV